MPTNNQLQQAKTFLLHRLNAEQSASRNLSVQLLIFANKLLALYKKYNCTPEQAANHPMLQLEIQLLLNQFKDELYSDLELLCIDANPDHKDSIILLMNTAIFGLTLKERINHWSSMTLTYLQNQIQKGIKSFKRIPTTIDGMYGLDRLFRQTITDIFMHEWKEKNPQATGFYSYRSSSYPCTECDEMQGYHPIKDYPTYGNWHPNCVCLLVFTTATPDESSSAPNY